MDSIEVTEYVDVRRHAESQGLCLTSELVLLPRGFEAIASGAELAHEAEAATVHKLLKAAGIDAQLLQHPDRRVPSVVERSATWIAPTVFVGSMLLTQSPHAIQIALNVISSYITDILKARNLPDTVKLTVVIEETKSKRCRRVEYEGSACKLKELAEVLNALQNDSR